MPLYMYNTLQAKEKLQQEKEGLERKLREMNLKVIDITKAYPHVAALLNYNNSVNASTTTVNKVSTKADSVKRNVHKQSDSEGNF